MVSWRVARELKWQMVLNRFSRLLSFDFLFSTFRREENPTEATVSCKLIINISDTRFQWVGVLWVYSSLTKKQFRRNQGSTMVMQLWSLYLKILSLCLEINNNTNNNLLLSKYYHSNTVLTFYLIFITTLLPFNPCGTWGSEHLSNLPRIQILFYSITKAWAQLIWPQALCS